jgi:S1-C subfamily serine protease
MLPVNVYGIMVHPVFNGDSGGGVYNTKGELLGIINTVLSLREYNVMHSILIGYAIPLEIIKEFLK